MKGIFSELSGFLTAALQSWLHFQFHPPENNDHILQQMLWLNSGTLSGGATIFSEQMFLQGVMIVKDIILYIGRGNYVIFTINTKAWTSMHSTTIQSTNWILTTKMENKI